MPGSKCEQVVMGILRQNLCDLVANWYSIYNDFVP